MAPPPGTSTGLSQGCPAFALSVGEVLRAYLEDVRLPEPAAGEARPRRRKKE